MGTSMCGMNADRVAVSCAERQGALGTVIVGLQSTQHDHLATLRIYATIDAVMRLLAAEMGVAEEPSPEQIPGVVDDSDCVARLTQEGKTEEHREGKGCF